MRIVNIRFEIPDWVDEEKFIARMKRLAEKVIYPDALTVEEAREIFGVMEEEIEPVDVRSEERERIKWLYSILQQS